MRLMIDSDMAKMPSSCYECPLCIRGFCYWAPDETDGTCSYDIRPNWCPIINAEEHDIISVEAVARKLQRSFHSDDWKGWAEWLRKNYSDEDLVNSLGAVDENG